MDIVTDTNIFLTVVLEESQKEKIIQLTSDCNAISPEILPYEIGNALSAIHVNDHLLFRETLGKNLLTKSKN